MTLLRLTCGAAALILMPFAAAAQTPAVGGSTTGSIPPGYSAANVDPTNPLAGADVTGASTNMSAFVDRLTCTQRTDLAGRCSVINDPANAARYGQDARDFCRSFMMVASSGNFGASANGVAAATGANVTGAGGGGTSGNPTAGSGSGSGAAGGTSGAPGTGNGVR